MFSVLLFQTLEITNTDYICLLKCCSLEWLQTVLCCCFFLQW